MTTETFIPRASSYIVEAGWTDQDPDSPEPVLTISFTDGATFRYLGVPYPTYRGLTLAASPGSYFYKNIRDSFSYEPG